MPGPHCYEYPRPSVTVDLVVFAWAEQVLRVLLIERQKPPYAGAWALPGGFLDLDEEPAAAALRELREETGLAGVLALEPLGFFGAVGRDPRGRTISLAHVGVVAGPLPAVAGGDDAAAAAWVPLDRLDRLAFDHDQILAQARAWLAPAVVEGSVGVLLLPERFERAEVERLLAAVGVAMDADGWLARQQAAGRVVAVDGPTGTGWRRSEPA